MAVLGILGALTTIFSGVEAALHSKPSAVLGCAAMSALGIVVQVMAIGSGEALAGALTVLIHRTTAVLLASSALAAMDNLTTERDAAPERPIPWPGLILLLIFVISMLALVRVLLFPGNLAIQHMNTILQTRESHLTLVWRISIVGVIIGLMRSGWQAWHDKVRASARRICMPSFLVVILLFLLWLWMESSPKLTSSWISALVVPFLPL